jgi:D-arabinose 1-dehydrogenase-like Zn-dependent alcohol dehydrogenase
MTMRAVEVAKQNGPLHLVERDVPERGRGEVRIKVEACGVCHSDSLAPAASPPRCVPATYS